MDFDALTRRELQTLCKRNGIPANVKNVAMADALKSLEIVDGIEELLHERQSVSAQLSIESPVSSEPTTPYLPPTGGRSTRRRNVAKEESESVKPVTRTQRTAPKSLVKNAGGSKADVIQTPSVASQSNRKNVQMASACRKMDTQLKECVDDEMKDVLGTPAPSGATSRRRTLKEESRVKRVYSTRRSARLAEKNMVLLNEKENENSVTFKEDLFAEDQTVGMNLKESLDCSEEITEITGIHESSEKKNEIEALSAPEQDTSVVGGELMSTVEEEIGNYIEANGSKPEVKEGGDMEIISIVERKDKVEIMEENSEEKREVIPAQEQDLSFVPEGELVSILEEEMTNKSVADASKSQMRDVGDADITVTIEKIYEVETVSDQTKNVSIVSEEELVSTIEEETCSISAMEVASAQEHDVPIVSEPEPLSTIEEESGNNFEADGSKKEEKEGSDVEIQKVGVGFETETAREEQKWCKSEDPQDENIFMLLNVSNEVQEDDGSPDTSASEVHISVKNTEEPSTEKHADSEYKARDLKENLVVGNEDNFVIDDVPFDTDIRNETEEDIYNGKDMNSEDITKVNENDNVKEFKSEVHVDVSAPNSTGLVISEEAKEEEPSTNAMIQSTNDPMAYLGFDISLMNEEAETKMKLDFSNWNAVIAELSQEWDAIGGKTEAKLELQAETISEKVAAEQKMPLDAFNRNSHLTLTPIISSAENASATKRRLTAAVLDNKENIGSGTKLNFTKDTAQNDPRLDSLSRRKLSEMLKDQLQMTNKSSKNENENEAPARQALQALSENR